MYKSTLTSQFLVEGELLQNSSTYSIDEVVFFKVMYFPVHELLAFLSMIELKLQSQVPFTTYIIGLPLEHDQFF